MHLSNSETALWHFRTRLVCSRRGLLSCCIQISACVYPNLIISNHLIKLVVTTSRFLSSHTAHLVVFNLLVFFSASVLVRIVLHRERTEHLSHLTSNACRELTGINVYWHTYVSQLDPLRKVHLQPLLDKIKRKMLSSAGTLTTLKAVLTSIPIYHMTLADLEAWTWKTNAVGLGFRAEMTHARGNTGSTGASCTAPKRLGGLGVLQLTYFSQVLRLRWLWYQ